MRWYKVFPSAAEAKKKINDRSTILVRINEKLIFVARINDEYYAGENDCPHQGQALHEGTINYLREIVCPWHAYRFNLKSGQEASQKCRDLKIYEVKVDKEGLFIKC